MHSTVYRFKAVKICVTFCSFDLSSKVFKLLLSLVSDILSDQVEKKHFF